jgi:trehalose 6-phosphate phosphatase
MMEKEITFLTHKAARAKVLRLFLDYDGTLAEFAPTPDTILPNEAIITLMQRLVSASGLLPAIISGRCLPHIRKLLPVDGLLMAGTYGIEIQLSDGNYRSLLPFEQVRPIMERLLPRWQALVADHKGFYLEDKGWSLALHGRFAAQEEAQNLMAAARVAVQELSPGIHFQLKDGDRFLELVPSIANKAISVQWMLEELTPKDALVVYIGDDDKDEEAFSPVLAAGGYAIRVANKSIETHAQYRLQGPAAVLTWLNEVLSIRGA